MADAQIRRQLEEHAVATMPHEPVNGSEEFARELLDRVRAVLVGVPAGPWTLQGWGEQNQNGDYAESILFDGDGETMTYGLADREGDFIAQARTLVPELAAELDRWLAVVAEFRRRDASAERLITRLKAERAQLNEYIGDLDREIDHPLTVEAQDAGRRIRSASDPVQAFDAFIEKWLAPRWHGHLLDHDGNDAEYVRTAIRGSQR